MSDKCCIKVTTQSVDAKAIVAIHKLTGLSLADIKTRVSLNAPIAEFEQSDMNGWAAIVQLSVALEALDTSVQAYLGDIPFPTSYFINRLQSAKEEIADDGEEDVYQDEPWWNLDLSKFE